MRYMDSPIIIFKQMCSSMPLNHFETRFDGCSNEQLRDVSAISPLLEGRKNAVFLC